MAIPDRERFVSSRGHFQLLAGLSCDQERDCLPTLGLTSIGQVRLDLGPALVRILKLMLAPRLVASHFLLDSLREGACRKREGGSDMDDADDRRTPGGDMP